MEGGSGIRRHTHSHTRRLLQQMCAVCASEGSQVSELLENADISAALDWLVCMYILQDREIHRVAQRQYGDVWRLSLAEREEWWLRQDGANVFFSRRFQASLGTHHPEVFQPDVFMMAWNCFQMLLMVVHIDYLARTLGHTPSQAEYLNPDLYKWFERIAARFRPIRENDSATLH